VKLANQYLTSLFVYQNGTFQTL